MGPRIFIRGYAEDRCKVRRCHQASMGPRIFIRGYGRSPRPPAPGRQSFNGAADFHPRIRKDQYEIVAPGGASMGPRIFIRGYATDAWQAGGSGAASMGPRIFIRGYFADEVFRANHHTLQWGRGFSSADTVVWARHGAGQKGFNGAADFHPRIRGPGMVSGHNKSASMGPRIFIRGYVLLPLRPSLLGVASMGPRIFIRGYGGVWCR